MEHPSIEWTADGFRTERIEARRLTPDGLADLTRLLTHPVVGRTLGGARTPGEVAEFLEGHLEHWTREGFGDWLLYGRSTGPGGSDFLGRVGLRRTAVGGEGSVELAYALLPEAWGKGYGTEASRAAMAFAVERGIEELVCYTLLWNAASRRVMRAVGFRYERDIMHATWPHAFSRWRQGEADGDPGTGS